MMPCASRHWKKESRAVQHAARCVRFGAMAHVGSGAVGAGLELPPNRPMVRLLLLLWWRGLKVGEIGGGDKRKRKMKTKTEPMTL